MVIVLFYLLIQIFYVHTYKGTASGKNPWGKLVLIVSDVMRSFASMRELRF